VPLALRIVLFAYASALVGIIAVHNPFLGYTNTALPSIEGDERRFDDSLDGCGGDARSVWEYFHNRSEFLSRIGAQAQFEGEAKAKAELDRMRARESNEFRAQADEYNKKCVKTRHYFHAGAQKSFFEWQSLGAFVPGLSTGLSFTVFTAAVTAVALLAALLFGRSARRDA
jgi:hypothetical protein